MKRRGEPAVVVELLGLELVEREHDAVAALRGRDGLGRECSDYYAISRRWELKAWQQTVTDWERSRYERGV